MSRYFRTAATALILALVAPAAASAGHWSDTDEVGDVEGYTYSPDPEPCGTFTDFEAPEETGVDLTGLQLRHTRTQVVLTADLRDLVRRREQMLMTYLRTDRGTWWLDVDRFRAGGRWRVETFLSKEPRYPDPEEIDECGGFGVGSLGLGCRIEANLSFADDQVRVAVPRTCLKNPRWVRVGAESYGFGDVGDPENETFTGLFDAWEGGPVLSDWTVSYGPRVRARTGASLARLFGGPDRAMSERRAYAVRDGVLIPRR